MSKSVYITLFFILVLILLGGGVCFFLDIDPFPPSDVAFTPIDFDPNATHEEMLQWFAKVEKQDRKLKRNIAGSQRERNFYSGSRASLWNSETVLKKVAEWRIAHLDDEAKKELVRKAYQKTVEHIELIWATWENSNASADVEFAGNADADLSRRQIELWLLPDDEYEAWMSTWSNARLSFQGKEIPLTSGMGHAKLLHGEEGMGFLLKHENCFMINGEHYALVESNWVASPTDDCNRATIYRLASNGLAIPIADVVFGSYVSKIELRGGKDSDVLEVDWKTEDGEKGDAFVLLLQ